MRLHYEFSKPPIEGVHRSKSRRVSIAADFPRQINQRNDDGKCADDLADCTNRFPIHRKTYLELDGNLSSISASIEGSLPENTASWQDSPAVTERKAIAIVNVARVIGRRLYHFVIE